jgi:hypothetical protein
MPEDLPNLTDAEYEEACTSINEGARDMVMLAQLYCVSQNEEKLKIIHGLATLMLEHRNDPEYEEAFDDVMGSKAAVAGHKLTLAVSEHILEFKRRMDRALSEWVEEIGHE